MQTLLGWLLRGATESTRMIREPWPCKVLSTRIDRVVQAKGKNNMQRDDQRILYRSSSETQRSNGS